MSVNQSGWRPEMGEASAAAHATFTGNRALMLPDGIHPNAQGVDRIVARLGPVVAARLRG